MKSEAPNSLNESLPIASAPAEVAIELSVVIPISEPTNSIRDLHDHLLASFSSRGDGREIIYVLDGPNETILHELRKVSKDQPTVSVIVLNRQFGEATALAVGLDRARGRTILTVPSYPQVELDELPRVVRSYADADVDLLVARRFPRIDSRFNRLQSAIFHRITGVLTGTNYHDISCGVRIMNRTVADEVALYGDLHRFFPLLAYQKGFRVEELPVKQSAENTQKRLYRPGVYLRRLLDILTLFFLLKFTKKPLRFFGLLGSAVFGAGALCLLYLGVYRLLQLGSIADRPLLILGALLSVLGVQLFSIGLLGEIVIFTHAGRSKDYHIAEYREDLE